MSKHRETLIELARAIETVPDARRPYFIGEFLKMAKKGDIRKFWKQGWGKFPREAYVKAQR